jgi:hypothetical protein
MAPQKDKENDKYREVDGENDGEDDGDNPEDVCWKQISRTISSNFYTE